MTKAQVDAIHVKLVAALKEFAVANDLVVGTSRIHCRDGVLEVKDLRLQPVVSNPQKVDPRFLTDLRKNGWIAGLREAHIGAKLLLPPKRGQTPEFVFVGMRASKAVCQNCWTKKSYLFDAAYIAGVLQCTNPQDHARMTHLLTS